MNDNQSDTDEQIVARNAHLNKLVPKTIWTTNIANIQPITISFGNQGYLYVEGGSLKWHGSSGTITTLAAA